jgi:transposase
MLDESESQTDTRILPSYGTASVNFHFITETAFYKYGIDNPDMNKLQFHLMLDEFF